MKLHRIGLINLIWVTTLFFFAEPFPPPYSCDESNPSTKSYHFCDTTLPIFLRVQDLISRLTLDEKISQLIETSTAIPRLNISSYQWWSEALHGVARHGKGTWFNNTLYGASQFPEISLTAASFDRHLWYSIGRAIGIEARAMYNHGQGLGLSYWTPNVNILRDPRWGRAMETPGEDPLVVGKYAVSYVRGMQGDSIEGGNLKDGHLMVSACCKHFTANDLEDWGGINRYHFDAQISKQDMADTYEPPFQRCIQEAQASGIMCGYNAVNGVPSCGDYNLLTRTARGKWGFQGYIASDCDGVMVMQIQGYSKEPEDAVAFALKAGMDVNCGTYMKNFTKSAVQQKKVSESEIDRALYNSFSVRMRLGLFNGNPNKTRFGNLHPDQVCSKEHLDLALEAARSGMVLLKNNEGLLPLSKTKTKTLAVIGPNAIVKRILVGDYEGFPCRNVTILQALKGYVKNTLYHQGCNFANCSAVTLDAAIDITQKADEVVLIMGLDLNLEREGKDRLNLTLPMRQESFIMSVAKAAKKPVVLVLLCGGPVDINFAKNNSKIGSILWAGYPGEAGPFAVAQIIFGDHNPGGRLPVTWYPRDFINIPMTNMRMRPDPETGYPGRTYRFYNGPKVFEFGYGLSYSNFSYEFISVTQSSFWLNELSTRKAVKNSGSVRYILVSAVGTGLCDAAKFTVIIGVKNEGVRESKQPLLLFMRPEELRYGNPIKQLVGFESVSLKAEERAEIEFVVKPCEHFSSANKDGLMVIEEGSYYLAVGDKEYPINIAFTDAGA